MGNCQAVDAATLVIQHPTGKVEKLYWPITAAEVMKTNPGHYVALLLSTTLYPPTSSSATNATKSAGGSGGPVRLTRIKLLRPTDTLTLGHVYRLITNQEVMKGLLAKKQAKLNQNNTQSAEDQQSASKSEDRRKQSSSVLPTTISETDESRRRRRSHGGSHPVTRNERNRGSSSSSSSSSSLSAGGAGSGSGSGRSSRTWQPSLNSILESAGSSSSSI
ncbi:unnamed protein product [Linum tenue]|uniref:DUF4228 domain-containing protein n=1 Tax=Linum tenue TaxID=586396 RepID=A0AAV0INW1_9ROSI|nr:unnamed protein product [Linum tenue]